jgi:hypothetical protein
MQGECRLQGSVKKVFNGERLREEGSARLPGAGRVMQENFSGPNHG